MARRKCTKCGSVWTTSAPKCAFCGGEGEILPDHSGPVVPAPAAEAMKKIRERNTSGPPVGSPDAPGETGPESGESDDVPLEEPPSPGIPEEPEDETPDLGDPGDIPMAESPTPGIIEPEETKHDDDEIVVPPRVNNEELKEYRRVEAVDVPEPKPASPSAGPSPAPEAPPMKAPVIFGALALAGCILLPLCAWFEAREIVGSVGLALAGLLAPLPPLAVLLANRYRTACEKLDLTPSRWVRTARMVGRIAAVLIAIECGALLVIIGVLRLLGKIPSSIWGPAGG